MLPYIRQHEATIYRVFSNRTVYSVFCSSLEGTKDDLADAVELARYLANECGTAAEVRRDYTRWNQHGKLEETKTNLLCIRRETDGKVHEHKLNRWDWTETESNSYGPTCHLPECRG